MRVYNPPLWKKSLPRSDKAIKLPSPTFFYCLLPGSYSLSGDLWYQPQLYSYYYYKQYMHCYCHRKLLFYFYTHVQIFLARIQRLTIALRKELYFFTFYCTYYKVVFSFAFVCHTFYHNTCVVRNSRPFLLNCSFVFNAEMPAGKYRKSKIVSRKLH